MRYIRFLKTPRVVTEKNTAKKYVNCLITITSDLGDSFLPYDIQLSAELLSCGQKDDRIVVWRSVEWAAGMRTLSISIPLPKSHAPSSQLRVRVGQLPQGPYDDYATLSHKGARGVVSAWSPPFTSTSEAAKLVERRLQLSEDSQISIWEETGESIARHLWDAGITLSCHLSPLSDAASTISKTLLPTQEPGSTLRILELGTGCGIVGIALAQTLQNASVTLTDLPEAQEIVQRNIDEATTAENSSLEFLELDWDGATLPGELQVKENPISLVVAADCTYNPDSCPALVHTLSLVGRSSPDVVVAIAMKMRHASEQVFFDLMADAGFVSTAKLTFALPGDEEVGEESVDLHVYKSSSSSSSSSSSR